MSEPFTVFIAEDEPLARESLVAMFQVHPQWRVIGSAGSGQAALHACLATAPDLLLTDIRMPQLSGLELVAALRAEIARLRVVFVTAYDEHAVAAFRLAAVDFLQKPLADREFSDCLHRVEATLRDQRILDAVTHDQTPISRLLRNQSARLRRIVVRSVGRTDIVALADVTAFKATGNYVEVVTSTRRLLHRQTMKSLAELLDPDAFVQIHRTAIVAVAQIASVERVGGGHLVVLRDGSQHPLSAAFRAQVLACLQP